MGSIVATAASYQNPADLDSTDDELLSDHVSARPTRFRRRMLVSALGAFALLACGILAAMSLPPAQRKSLPTNVMSARALLESPELTDVATDQIMEVGRKHPSKRQRVKAIVAEGFRNVTASMKKNDPVGFEKFAAFQLTQEQRAALLQILPRMTDIRVQNVGRDVAQAIVYGKSRTEVKHNLMSTLQPHLAEIRELRDELIPAALRDSPDETHNWHISFDPERMRIMKKIPSEWNMEIDISRPEASAKTNHVVPSRRLKQLSRKMWALEEGLGVINAVC